MKGYSLLIGKPVITVVLSAVLVSLLLSSCNKMAPNNSANNSSVGSENGTTTVISDNDSIRLYMLQLPSANEYIPCKTEIWYESKKSGNKYIVVASNPEVMEE